MGRGFASCCCSGQAMHGHGRNGVIKNELVDAKIAAQNILDISARVSEARMKPLALTQPCQIRRRSDVGVLLCPETCF